MCATGVDKAAALLPILTVSSDSCRAALASWEASLDRLDYPRSLRLVVHLGELNPPPGYCTASWALAPERKVQEVVSYLTTHRNHRVIVADVRMQFFPSFIEAQRRWLQMMDLEKLDMLFAREQGQALSELREGEVSTRLFVIHSSESAVNFWNQVLYSLLAEPKMASYLPDSVQHHVNNLLTCFPGSGPQDGAHGVSWNYIPDEELSHVVLYMPLIVKDLQVQARPQELHRPSGAPEAGAPRPAPGAPAAEPGAEAEAGRLAAELRRLRQELESNPHGRLERHRPALALAAARLLAEVTALAGSVASGAVPAAAPGARDAGGTALRARAFEAVD